MLFAIDIGNTNITFGIFQGIRIIKRFNIPTQDYTLKKLRKVLTGFKIKDSVICSVVPKMTSILSKGISQVLCKKPLIIGKDIIVPVRNLYRNPRQVGQDRLVNAYAGLRLYGPPLIIVDFGTAVTFDCVSKRGEYLGGIIAPGLRTNLEALAQRTALLPQVKLTKPKEVIGRDTKQSMLSGAVYGTAILADGLILKLKSLLGRNTKVIGTGGDIALIKEYAKEIDHKDQDLTLKGFFYLYKNLYERK